MYETCGWLRLHSKAKGQQHVLALVGGTSTLRIVASLRRFGRRKVSSLRKGITGNKAVSSRAVTAPPQKTPNMTPI